MRNSIFEHFRDRHIFVLRRNYGESLDTLSTLSFSFIPRKIMLQKRLQRLFVLILSFLGLIN